MTLAKAMRELSMMATWTNYPAEAFALRSPIGLSPAITPVAMAKYHRSCRVLDVDMDHLAWLVALAATHRSVAPAQRSVEPERGSRVLRCRMPIPLNGRSDAEVARWRANRIEP